MRVLVVYCHPKPDSYVAAMRDAAIEGLKQAGHEPQIVDLYAEGFDPRFSAEEQRELDQVRASRGANPVFASLFAACCGNFSNS